MKIYLAFFLILNQFYNFSDFSFTNSDEYLDTIYENVVELEDNNLDEINKLYKFIKENSLYDIKGKILKDEILKAILNSLDDKYSNFTYGNTDDFINSTKGEYTGLGFDLARTTYNNREEFIISNVLENSSAYENNLKAGDIIYSINSIKIAGNNKIYEGALELSKNKEHIFEIIRDEKKQKISLKAKPYNEPPISTKIINKNIYYIKVNNCSIDMPERLAHHLKKVNDFKYENLIIDLRFNRGGLESSVIKAISLFCNNEIVGYTKDKMGVKEIKRSDNKQIINIKPMVLISENTASSAELFANQLKEYSKATLIGIPTYGKNIAQGVYEFNGNLINLSVQYISANKDFDTKNFYVKPDYLIENPYELPYRDKTLEKAIELFK